MRLPLLCLALGHAPSFENVGDLVKRGSVYAELDICARCDRVFVRRLSSPHTARPKAVLDLWPVLLRLAPKGKLSDLSDAISEQGFVIDLRPIPVRAIGSASTAVTAGNTSTVTESWVTP